MPACNAREEKKGEEREEKKRGVTDALRLEVERWPRRRAKMMERHGLTEEGLWEMIGDCGEWIEAQGITIKKTLIGYFEEWLRVEMEKRRERSDTDKRQEEPNNRKYDNDGRNLKTGSDPYARRRGADISKVKWD